MTQPGLRVGWGFDAHRFGGAPPVVLGGVVVDGERGVQATSDGDVAAHALCDAVLGAANLGDMGMHFPSSDPTWHHADSLDLLRRAAAMAAQGGLTPVFADVTIVCQEIRVAPHRERIREGLAGALGLEPAAMSVKATTTDGVGFIGRDEGLAAVAVLTVRSGS